MSKKISYSVRDFGGLRDELVSLAKKYYPDLISNFNDASIFSVLLDLNAAIGDNLHFHIDRVWQETMLEYAKQRHSLYHIAKTYGIKIQGPKPSVALCDFSINVPVLGDKDDERYEGIIKAGAQISGGGMIFETMEEIDFSIPYNAKGEPNRLKIPNFDHNNNLVSYTIIKRSAIVNGTTKVYKRVITELEQKPFFKIFLPEKNVLSVESIIHKDGVNYTTNPTNSEYLSSQNRWYEVPSLAEDLVFIEDPTNISDSANFKSGKYIKTNNKFIGEYTPEGYFCLTFGSGSIDPMENLDKYMTSSFKVNLSSLLNNTSLGFIPKENTTLFVKYRVGGGKNSNIGINVINTIETIDFIVNGPNQIINGQVKQSIKVSNITPAVGGKDIPTIEEIRNMIAYNFSAQNRAVTLHDYRSLIETMPGKFGAPAKCAVLEEDNKVKIKLLSYDNMGNLTNTVSLTLKENILNYLSKYRMINDFIEVDVGEVIDLGIDVDLIIDKNENQSDLVREVIEKIKLYFDVNRRKMGDPLFVGEIISMLGNTKGIINVVSVRIFNKYGFPYSTSEVLQPYKNKETREIEQSDLIIFMKQNQIFQIRFPSSDIRIRVKKIVSTSY